MSVSTGKKIFEGVFLAVVIFILSFFTLNLVAIFESSIRDSLFGVSILITIVAELWFFANYEKFYNARAKRKSTQLY